MLYCHTNWFCEREEYILLSIFFLIVDVVQAHCRSIKKKQLPTECLPPGDNVLAHFLLTICFPFSVVHTVPCRQIVQVCVCLYRESEHTCTYTHMCAWLCAQFAQRLKALCFVIFFEVILKCPYYSSLYGCLIG